MLGSEESAGIFVAQLINLFFFGNTSSLFESDVTEN